MTAPIHVFRHGDTAFGFTRDPQGTNLPIVGAGGGWSYFYTIHPKASDGPLIGPKLAVISARLEVDGFYIKTEAER